MTKEEVQKSMKYGKVFDISEFARDVRHGYFTEYDGVGYFHDGEKETDENVFTDKGNFRKATAKKYKFVCWYNK